MTKLFSGSQPDLPPPPAPPGRSDADIRAEGTATRKRMRGQRGRASTILNDGSSETATPASKILLGE